jgi:hypothetical protein
VISELEGWGRLPKMLILDRGKAGDLFEGLGGKEVLPGRLDLGQD